MSRKYPENRDQEKRNASRKAYYERSKHYWVEVRRKKRQAAGSWLKGIPQQVLDRIEDIVRKA